MIVVGGENLIDLVQVREEGGLPEFRAIPGGSQFNCAMALGLLGAKVRYVTPISSDKLGDMLAQTLEDCGVDVASARPAAASSLAVVTLEGGQPTYSFYRNGTAERLVSAKAISALVPSDTQVFQVGSLALADGEDAEAWTQVFLTLAKRGVRCTLDPNVRPSFVGNKARYLARLTRMMAVASLVKLSDEDLSWLYPDEDLELKCQSLLAQSAAHVFVLTKGAQGAVLFTKSARVEVPVHPVPTMGDTVGAGDTFMAALIYQLQNADQAPDAEQLKQIGAFAAKAAAINCGRTGCHPPTLAEVVA